MSHSSTYKFGFGTHSSLRRQIYWRPENQGKLLLHNHTAALHECNPCKTNKKKKGFLNIFTLYVVLADTYHYSNTPQHTTAWSPILTLRFANVCLCFNYLFIYHEIHSMKLMNKLYIWEENINLQKFNSFWGDSKKNLHIMEWFLLFALLTHTMFTI